MKAYQLKITLKNSHPPIWRRCIVPAGITFSQLSIILNKIMGWSGYHLFEFEFYHLGLQISEVDEFDDLMSYNDFEVLESSKTFINEYMDTEDWFTYTYDFGDDWSHRVTIEKVLNDYDYNFPIVVKYKGACPMEDCGGIDGYYEKVEIMKDAFHPMHDEITQWAKEQLYTEEYDIEAINEDLKETCFVTLGKGDKRKQGEIYEDMLSGDYGLFGSKSAKYTKQSIKSQPDQMNDLISLFTEDFAKSRMDNSNTITKEDIIEHIRGLFSKPLTLEELLNSFTRNEIKIIAQSYGLKGISSLKKQELIQKTIETMLTPSVMEQAFLPMRDNEIEAFEKAMEKGIYYMPAQGEEKLFERFYDLAYIGIRENGMIDVPIEVKSLYQRINTSNFIINRKHVSWIRDCFFVASMLYGVVPMKIMLKLVNRHKKLKFDEHSLMKYISMIPKEELGFVTIDDMFVDEGMLYKDIYKNLMACQGDKEYYIPTVAEIEDAGENQFFSKDEYVQKLAEYLSSNEERELDRGYMLAGMIQNKIRDGYDMQDIFDIINEYGILEEDDKDISTLTMMINNVWNNTRMIVNRGFTPNELTLKEIKYRNPMSNGRMPTIVPGSSTAAQLLMDGKEHIQKMGYHIDFDANATTIPVISMSNGVNGAMQENSKKIYPNDPCPCGSGKKFKRCCGGR